MTRFPYSLRAHEAGHAVASWLHGHPIRYITLEPRGGRNRRAAGLCRHEDPATPEAVAQTPRGVVHPNLEEGAMWRSISIALAGPLAEVRASKRNPLDVMLRGGADDWGNSLELAALRPEYDLMTPGEELARRIVGHFWAAIDAVADFIDGKPRTEGAGLMALLDDGAKAGRWPARQSWRLQ